MCYSIIFRIYNEVSFYMYVYLIKMYHKTNYFFVKKKKTEGRGVKGEGFFVGVS